MAMGMGPQAGLQWMGLLVTDLVILGILWGTFCCVYGCCFRTKLVIHSSGAPGIDPAVPVGVQLAYPAHMHPAPGVVQQGYPVPHIVHQGYPVHGQHAPPAPAAAASWPTPLTPPGPKVQHSPIPGAFAQPGTSSWQAPHAP
ncbi:hypothetical protein AXG93_4530s1070 [Marchantia polymorpha subsp. ruderalis]|uniref:Uncharacterized protein n=1 Tax=Marchantia polymorpha subsp. ruderalis TaxID=1480154 RepID=A0A176VW84_MARPO|nr:hypothetical protein AXG93_4530s1070 [Marchantia polymorpha subsp. ruderalis]